MLINKTPNDYKNDIVLWLNAIRQRQSSYSFRFVQARLREEKMPTASGWGPLITKYEDLNYGGGSIDGGAYTSALMDIHRNSVMFGTSTVWLFSVPVDDSQAIAPLLGNLVNDSSEFAQNFPKPVDPIALLALGYNGEFVALHKQENNDLVIFACAKRAFRHRELIVVDDLKEDSREFFDGYEEIIGVRSGFTQAYDRIVLRVDTNQLELHIDMCCPLSSEELQKIQVFYITKLKMALEKLLRRNLDWMNNPINLFPFIEKLYNTKDGLVLSLGHATGTKSIKEERMRGRNLDLRDELFHVHGINAIKSTDAFSIKKGWVPDSGIHVPSVYIPGRYANAGAAYSVVRHAIIESCATQDDFNMVIGKLV